MSKVDLELKKAFTELQEKQLDTQQKLRISDIKIEKLKNSKLHAMYTDNELSTLEPSTRTFESVGRMFVLTPLPELKESLKKKQVDAVEKIATLENNKKYLESSLAEATNSLRELVAQKKEH